MISFFNKSEKNLRFPGFNQIGELPTEQVGRQSLNLKI